MTKYDQAEPSTDKYGPSTTKYDQVRKRRTKYGPSMDQVRTKYGPSTDKYGQVRISTDKYGQVPTSKDMQDQLEMRNTFIECINHFEKQYHSGNVNYQKIEKS